MSLNQSPSILLVIVLQFLQQCKSGSTGSETCGAASFPWLLLTQVKSQKIKFLGSFWKRAEAKKLFLGPFLQNSNFSDVFCPSFLKIRRSSYFNFPHCQILGHFFSPPLFFPPKLLQFSVFWATLCNEEKEKTNFGSKSKFKHYHKTIY